MEALSFSLGMAFVVVIATVIVAVYALVRVSKLQKTVEGLCRSLEDTNRGLWNQIDKSTSDVHLRIGNVEESIYRTMDSRFDKLENKLIPKEHVKK